MKKTELLLFIYHQIAQPDSRDIAIKSAVVHIFLLKKPVL